MAKKKKRKSKRSESKPDVVQNALRILEQATGEKLSKPAKQPKNNGKA